VPELTTRASVAAIDIGTNSVRLLIVGADGAELTREMHITRLGQGVDQTGSLADTAIERTTGVLASFARELERHGTKKLRITATSAARDADNRDVFFDQVRAIIGSKPELLSGSEEARLSFFGATASLTDKPGPFLIFDIGGGSTEFARGTSTPEAFLSLDVGAVRITERYLSSDPPAPRELVRATSAVRELLARVTSALNPDGSETWVGLAGTVTTFAAHAAGLGHYDPRVTHGMRLERDPVAAFAERLWASTTQQRRPLLMEPKRAEVIVGGAVVLLAIFDHFELDEIVTSERDILDGLVASLR
jgi:exopolyphosphatase/guanosine-5'-triphosphate,3'-diphosphate pyrophosphatase